MFGCLRKIGCLAVLVAAGAGYYWYTHHSDRETAPEIPQGIWAPVGPEDAEAGRSAVAPLRESSGQVFASLTPAQAVAYLLQSANSGTFLASADGLQAMVTGDTLHVKSLIALKDFGATQVLGPLASVLNTRDTVQLSGRVSLVRSGVAQFRITDARIHNLRLPRGAIPKLIGELRRGEPVDGVAPDGLPIILPSYIAEIRIANGKVTLYKNI